MSKNTKSTILKIKALKFVLYDFASEIKIIIALHLFVWVSFTYYFLLKSSIIFFDGETYSDAFGFTEKISNTFFLMWLLAVKKLSTLKIKSKIT